MLAQRHSKNIHPTTGPEKAFGDSLREFRRARNFSQEQLALSSSLDRTYVSLIERGIQSPTLRTVFRICEVLEVAPSDVIRRTEALWQQARSAKPDLISVSAVFRAVPHWPLHEGDLAFLGTRTLVAAGSIKKRTAACDGNRLVVIAPSSPQRCPGKGNIDGRNAGPYRRCGVRFEP